MYARFKWFIRQVSWLVLTAVFSTNPWSVRADAEEMLNAAVAYSDDNVGTIADEKALRKAFCAAPTDGTAATVTLGADITLETLYAAENFGTEKLDDNAEGDTFNRYKVGVHPTEEDPNHWNPLVTGQTQEQRLVYGAYYHMSATDERIARLVVKSGQKIVLDLNGHTIQKNARATHGDWSEVCTDIIGNYGTLEIVDSSTGAKGTVKGIGYTTCGGAVLHNYAGAKMTVTGVNVDGNAVGMSAGTGQYAIANEGGTLTLDGVNVHDTATSASLIMSNGGTVTIKNATLSHPAAKVINAKGGEINIESASVTSEKYAVFVTGDARVNVNGSLTIEGTGTLYVEGDAAALTKKPGVELSAPAGFTWVENDGVQVLKSFVAKVGETAYVTIAEAIAELSAENHTLTLLNENAWDAATPVYWAAGTQSGYAATLTEALTAAYKADAGAITVVCRPGADVGKMTHGHVADDLTIYGNDAYLSGGECDLEVDTYTFSRATGAQANDGVSLDKDIAITAYELDNLGVWGQRHTVHKVTVNLTDCDGKALEGKTNVQRVYISGTTGVNDITLTDCDFLTKATAVYSNADGAIKAVNCSFTDGQVPFNINHKANGTQTVAVENCRFTNCGDAGDWKQFAAPLRLVNSGAGTQSAEVMGCTFADTVGANGDILLGDGRTGQTSNDVELKVVKTAANIQAQKPGYYGGETVDATKKATAASPAEGTLETSVAKLLPVNDGSEAHPYSREQFAAMTRAEYSAAQKRLGGTLYVNVGDYAYEKDGVLGNGVRNDTPGQVPDHAKLNAYGENGYLGEKNDGANGHAVVFVGGTITSGVTGYSSMDSIGTSLLLAVPAYTKVTFKETAFKNVLSFNYQLYTSPWSQLGGLTFNGCTFDGIIVGAIAAQELAFNGCTFNDYMNTTSANNSNPTWIRPAYGNWTKGDNEGQGTDFRSLTNITFADNTVTSTRPVKFEWMAQWEMATTVKVTNNTFDITPQEGDTSTKNVGLYFGTRAKIDLVIDENKKSNETAALYTAVYKAPTDVTYVGLPAGSTVKDTAGEEVATEDALAWKTTDKITLKTTEEVASVTNAKGVSVNFATLADAIAAAKDGETVKLLADTNGDGIAIAPNTFKTGLTVDFGGHTYTVGGLLVGSSGTASNGFQLNAGNRITFKNGAIVGATATAGAGTDWKGAPAILIQNYCDLTLEQMTVKGGDETCYTLSNNNGEIVIDGSTVVAGKGTKYGPFAFDVCRYSSYPSVHVTVKGASVIDGNVEISGTVTDGQSRQLDIEGGMFKGAFKVVNQPANIAISGGTFSMAVDAVYCAAGFIPTENGDGTYGVKEGTYVAQIGTTGYETLQAAFDAAQDGEIVKLLADITHEGSQLVIAADKRLTLDLNGKTLKVSKFTAKAAQVSVLGSLTVTDGSAAQTGVICSDYTGTAGLVVCVEENGALTMKGGRITTEGMAQAGNAVKIATGGTVEMTGGTIVCDAKRNNVAVNLAGSSSRFTMTGGSVVADNGESTTAILAKSSESTLAISDAAKVSGPTAVSAKSEATTISGGTFKGTIKANKGVSGGTFDREVPLDVCTDYHESLKNEDGTYGIFPFTAIDVKTSIDGAATVRVRVSRSLLDRAGGTTLEEKVANLGKPEANGNLAWVNGVTGLEADKAVHAVDVPQNKYTKEGGVFIQAPVPVPKNSDAAVSYSIDGVDADGRVIVAGTETASGSLKIVLADIETSARFRVNVFVRSNDGTTVAKLVSENTVGVLKTATSAKKAIIAVPWLSLADGGNISVANLVKTAGLTKGDRLNVYNKAEKRYDVYELTAGKAWNPIAIYKIGADGAVETVSSGSPEATTVARGSGVWLERQDTKQPIVSYGQVPTEEVMTTIDAGTKETPTWDLLAVPTTEAVDLAATFGTDANDRILVPTEGAPRVYTVEDGAWGATKTVEVIDRWGNKTGGVKVIREAVTTLPAGTGFWYLNGGDATKVNW